MRKEYIVAGILAASRFRLGLPMWWSCSYFRLSPLDELWLCVFFWLALTIAVSFARRLVAMDRDLLHIGDGKQSGLRQSDLTSCIRWRCCHESILIWLLLLLDSLRNQLPRFYGIHCSEFEN